MTSDREAKGVSESVESLLGHLAGDGFVLGLVDAMAVEELKLIVSTAAPPVGCGFCVTRKLA